MQQLLKKVKVHTKFPIHEPKKVIGMVDPYTKAYPDKLMGELKIRLKNGKEYVLEKEDYYGFHTKPMSWNDVKKKFKKLSQKNAGKELQNEIIDVVSNLQKHKIKKLINLLARIGNR